MQIHNLHALDPQALSCIPPQQFSRLLDRVNAIQGANAADRLMARYSRARKDSAADQPRDEWASNRPTSIPVDGIEKMLAVLGDDPGPGTIPAEVSTGSIEQLHCAPSDQSILIDVTSGRTITTDTTPVAASGDFAAANNAELAGNGGELVTTVLRIEQEGGARPSETQNPPVSAGEPSEEFAPGCFGVAILFKASSIECKSCVFAARCEPLAATRWAALRSKEAERLEKTPNEIMRERFARDKHEALWALEAAQDRAASRPNFGSLKELLRQSYREYELREQRRGVRKALQTEGLSLDDLPDFYWDGDLLDEALRAGRKGVLDELIKEQREPKAAAQRRDEYVARGWPADLDDRPCVEKERLETEERRQKRNQGKAKWARANRAAAGASKIRAIPASTSSVPALELSPEWYEARGAELDACLARLPIAQARQYRRNRDEIIKDLGIALKAGGKISDYKLAKVLGIQEGNASNRNRRLKKFAGEIGGEWKAAA